MENEPIRITHNLKKRRESLRLEEAKARKDFIEYNVREVKGIFI